MAEVSVPYWIDTPNGTLAFNQGDTNNDGLFLTDVQGLDYPTIRAPIDNRPNMDGAILYTFLRGQRIPMITGELRYTHGTAGDPNDLTARRVAEDRFRSCLDSILQNDGVLRWLPTGATAVATSGSMDMSGNEITDAVRQAGLEGDDRIPEGTTGIWQPATNLVSNGSMEIDLSGWSSKNGSVGGTPAFVGRRGTHADSTSQNSFTMTPTANMGSGNTLLLTVTAGGAKLITSVTDTKGNTWVVDQAVASTGNVVSVNVARLSGGTPLTTSDTITVNLSGFSADHTASLDEFSGLLVTSSPVDVSATLSEGSTTSMSIGPTATTANAKDLVFAALAWKGGPGAVTASGYTAGYTVATAVQEGGSNNDANQVAYQVVSATGAQSISATLSTSSFNCGCIIAYKNAGGGSLSSDATASVFGNSSLKMTTAGINANEGAQISASVSASTTYTASAYVKASTGAALQLLMEELSGGVVGIGTIRNFTGTGDWQQITLTATTAGTTDTMRVAVCAQHTLATVFNLDGVQLEQAKIATPFVETNGSPSARGAARVQAPATSLDPQTGWFAAKVRFDFSGSSPPGGGTGAQKLFRWADDDNTRILVQHIESGSLFICQRQSTALDGALASQAVTINKGDVHLIIGAWDATHVYLSIDGAAFISTPQAGIPAITASEFDIGSELGAFDFLDGDVFWAAVGAGTLAPSDIAGLEATGNIGPGATTLDPEAQLVLSWYGGTSLFQGGLQQDQRSCTVRLLEPPQIQNQQGPIKQFQVNLVAADPTVYSVAKNSITSNPPGVNTSASVQGTWVFPFSFPLVFGDFTIPGTVGDQARVTNSGNAPTSPLITLFGPYTAPIITNLTTGFSLAFPALNMADSDVLVIDTQAQTVLLNGGQAIQFLNIAPSDVAPSSTFFQLVPGDNVIQINDTLQDTTSASMVVQWQSGWVA